MLKRTITGACYIAVIVGFLLLRQMVDYRIFHVLTMIFALVGTFEIARALKEYLYKGVFVTAIAFGALFVPVYCLGEFILCDFFGVSQVENLGYAFALGLIAVAIIFLSLYAIIKKSNIKIFGVNLLPFAYPSLFLLTMLLANDMGANAFGTDVGFIVLTLSFIIAPCADTLAYLTGSLIGGKKLCPKLSPKKTWSGAIGGVIGGILGALTLYFVLDAVWKGVAFDFAYPVILFILAGGIGSVLTIFGDLFESGIKRKVGIKDMGKILPGHGGILDRIDGQLFLSVYLFFLFFVA